RHELRNVHDFFVEFDLEIGPGTGEFAVGLSDGRDDVTAHLPVVPRGQPVTSNIRLTDASGAVLADGGRKSLAEGRTYRIEFSFSARRFHLSVDGPDFFARGALPPARDRKAVSRRAWLGASGAAVTVRNFRLLRDIHYASSGHNGTHEPCRLG